MVSEKPKIDYASFNLSQFNFRYESTNKNKFYNIFLFLLRKLTGSEWQMSPIIHTKSREKVDIKVLGDAIGLSDPVHQRLLAFHQDRLKTQSQIAHVIYLLIGFFLSLLASVVILSPLFSTNLLPLLIPVTLLYVFVSAGIAMRLSYLLTFRYFSDSMCIQTLIFLIIELARCQNPLTPFHKRQLLNRTEFLAKVTHSLVSYYDLNIATLEWAKKHFRQIENYIYEREKWIIAPRDSTLMNLQQDFYYLALNYISGNYGNFEYVTEVDIKDVASNNKIKNFLINLPRFVIGIIIPALVLLIVTLRPDLVTDIIDKKVLTLLCIGWLLLFVDATLKLGVVANVIEIVKGIKELT